eukprot:COSAG01_NODE_1060_length_11890_cov_17.763973_16_plen_108_part_01
MGRLGAPRCGQRSQQQAGAAAALAGGKLEKKSQFSASQRRRPHLATGMTDRRTTEVSTTVQYCRMVHARAASPRAAARARARAQCKPPAAAVESNAVPSDPPIRPIRR